MIRTRNRARGGFSAISPSQTFDLTAVGASLPADWFYAGSGSTSTYINSAGKLVAGTSNVPRFEYTTGLVPLGIKIELTATNKCTSYNYNPTATTNITVSHTGGGGETLTVVDDTAALAAAGLDLICTNGKVYCLDNTLGSGSAIADLGGTVANTNKHSYSVYARGSASGNNGYMAVLGSSTFPNITTTGYVYYKDENVTPSGTTNQLRVVAASGKIVYFILYQLEENTFSTSTILTAGASATRASDILRDQSINTRSYFNFYEGAIVADFDLDNITTRTSAFTLLSLTQSTDFVNTIGVSTQTPSTRSKTNARLYINSVTKDTTDITGFDVVGKRFPVAVSWKNGQTYITSAGGVTYNKVSDATSFSSLTYLRLGNAPFPSAMNGHLRKVSYFTRYLEPYQFGRYMVIAGEKVIPTVGQSIMTNWFSAQSGANNSGQRAAQAIMDAVWTSTRNWLLFSATAATAVYKVVGVYDTNNWWIDKDTGELGTPFLKWIEMVKGSGNGTTPAIIDRSGESDASNGSGSLKADFKTAQIMKWNIMRGMVGNVPIIMTPISRRDTSVLGYQTIREAQWELANEVANVYLGPEYWDVPLTDGLHPTDVGSATESPRVMRKLLKVLGESISGGVDGPRVTAVSRAVAVVTVTIAHDTGGSDFTPTVSIAGFHFFDGGSEIAVTAAIRTNATTITLTLASTPSNASQTLYYGYSSGSAEAATYTNFVKDNSTNTLLLRAAKFVSSNTGASFASS